MSKTVIAWWSGGITSAVACKIALRKFRDVQLWYMHINSHHPDTLRFKADCEKWYGQKIEQIQSAKYGDQFEVITKTRYVNGPGGARCTNELKRELRFLLEEQIPFSRQVFGFEFKPSEINRAERLAKKYPYAKPFFPLIERKLTKNQCAGIVIEQGIRLPQMYLDGFPNNNCIGCVKGGKAYWNLIREKYPENFERMNQAEQLVGHSCIKGTFLADLKPGEGRASELVTPEGCDSWLE